MGIKTDIARAFVTKYQDEILNGTLSKKHLARIIVQQHPSVYKDIEEARAVVRSLTAAGGGSGRTKPVFEFKSTQKFGLHAIPTQATTPEDFVIQGPVRILVVSDIHLPYHDPEALDIAFDYGRDCDIVLVNGDLLDFYKLSRFCQDPEARNVAYELDKAKQFFNTVRSQMPDARILYKLGNHEDRLEKYLWTKAPDLVGLPFTSIGELVDADDYDVEMIGTRQKIKAGRLNIIHGHEFGEAFFNPVNPARGLFLRAKCSTLAGHHHTTSEHSEGNINGEPMGCWTVGALCHLRPAYRPFADTKWNSGFAIVEVEEDGMFTVYNKRILGGKVH